MQHNSEQDAALHCLATPSGPLLHISSSFRCLRSAPRKTALQTHLCTPGLKKKNAQVSHSQSGKTHAESEAGINKHNVTVGRCVRRETGRCVYERCAIRVHVVWGCKGKNVLKRMGRERLRVKSRRGGSPLLNSNTIYSKHEFHCAFWPISGWRNEGRTGTNCFQVLQSIPCGWPGRGRLSP